MTAQIAESLHYEGQQPLCSEPLGDYFTLSGVNPRFESPSSANWRGYVGTWEIVDGRLYLVELHGALVGGGEASLATFFPNFPDRVFAHWVSRTLRVPQGRRLDYRKYMHLGQTDPYERDLLLEIDRGILKNTRIRYNGTANAGAPDGYGIGAMTVFPRGNNGVKDAS